MSLGTKIEWTEATWNPVTGCTEVSPGCDHCYAKTFAERWRGTPGHHFEQGFDVVLRPERLDEPLRWRKPRRVFVNSMSDLFHAEISDEFIARVWAVMAATPQHTYQILTKRHARMRSFVSGDLYDLMVRALSGPDTRPTGLVWPLPNVWLGVSVEDQQRAELRIPALLETPAAVRWLSCEPLLGPIILSKVELPQWGHAGTHTGIGTPDCPRTPHHHHDERCKHPVDWVVVGGESGPGARPMHPDWARSLRDQCTKAGVPFFFKQWGEWAEAGRDNATHLLQVDGKLVDRRNATVDNPYGQGSGLRQDLVDRGHQGWVRVKRTGKGLAGRLLDGRTWDEYPGGAS